MSRPGIGRLRRPAGGSPVVLIAVHSAHRAGAEIMALQEARELAARFELIAAVPDGPLRAQFGAVAELVAGPATMPLVGGGWRPVAKRIVRNLIDVPRWLRLIGTRRVELVITNSTVVVAPVLAAWILRVPVLVHARDVTDSPIARRLLGLHKRIASTIVALSGQVERSLGDRSRARIVCVTYGVDPPPMAPGAGHRALPGRARVAVVGTVEARKGQDLALEAIGILIGRGADLELVLIGREQEAAFATALRGRAAELGLDERRVRFTGAISDVASELAAVDIVIGPSRAEPLGLALMEAMALGKPVIAAQVGGIPEFIQDGVSGLLVTPDSSAALAEAVDRLVRDPEGARALGLAGRRHILANFTLERTMRAYAREVDRLLARDRAPQVRR